MTLDQLQYTFMIAVFPIAVFAILKALPITTIGKFWVGSVLTLWFLTTYLTTIPNLGRVPGALFGIIFPVLGISTYMFFYPKARNVIAQMNVVPVIALQTTRVAGGLFIPLFWEGRLSNPFAYIAGGGDLLSAVLAIPAAIIAYRGKAGWDKWVLAWNVIGFADFISAISLGVTSQPGSPLQAFSNLPGTSVLGELPWRFIPSYFVPLYLMIHVALFIRLLPKVLSPAPALKP
jgi:hypothetical protein